MAYVPGDALRRPASSSCKVVGTPTMEAEAHRMRSSALVLTAVGHFTGISVGTGARAVERDLRFPASDFVVALFFPEDFLLTMFQPAQRDMALERRSIIVAGVQFKLRPWLPPAGQISRFLGINGGCPRQATVQIPHGWTGPRGCTCAHPPVAPPEVSPCWVCDGRWDGDLDGCSGDPFPFVFNRGGDAKADVGRLYGVAKQARKAATAPNALRHYHPGSTAAAASEAFKKRFGNACFRCLGSRHKSFQCRDPLTCYSCKRPGHLERGFPVRLRSKRPISSSQAEPVPPPPSPTTPSASPPPSPPSAPAVPAKFGSVLVVPATTVRAPAVGHGTPTVRRATMAYVPGDALRRLASSSCKVVGTPAMEAEAHRIRSSPLVLTAVGHFTGISVDTAARAVERDLRFPASDFIVAPFFPEDFLLTMFQPAQRDMVLERRSIIVAEVQFKLRPWLLPAGTSIRAITVVVAIEKLLLTAWDSDSVKEVLGNDCELDLIERQSTTKANCSVLFAWLWTWHPDKIPWAADFTVLQRPDIVRLREFLPEGTSAEEGREGPSFPVLIHLDVVKDFTPTSPGRHDRSAWPRTYNLRASGILERRMGKEGTDQQVPAPTALLIVKVMMKRGMQEAMCRDTASREPEPRRHHRHHAVGTGGAARDEQQEQPAQDERSLAVSNVISAQGKRKLVQKEEWKTEMMQHAGMQPDKLDEGAATDSLGRFIHSGDEVLPVPAMQCKPPSLHIVPGSTDEQGSMEGQGDKRGSHDAVCHGPVVTEATSAQILEVPEMQAAGMDAIQPSHEMLQQARSILLQKEKGLGDPFAWDQTGTWLMSMWLEPAEQCLMPEAGVVVPPPSRAATGNL
ncbi:hypothetical protein ZWY2020_040872 [Hordeum vulgare]|nr:hypothetical protein ZWY2020_040872 [Hordeum vulgare]